MNIARVVQIEQMMFQVINGIYEMVIHAVLEPVVKHLVSDPPPS